MSGTRQDAVAGRGPGARRLIVNADDLGLSPGVNRGVFAAHERGIVTSASLMVRWPAARDAAEEARRHPRLGMGLHLDLGEWALREDGQWSALYEVADTHDAQAVAAEVERQVAAFYELVGRKPTHLDSHQHVHRRPDVRPVAEGVATRLAVPLRHYDRGVRYCGDFYGQDEHGRAYPEGVAVDRLVRIVRELSTGVHELACHPGYDDGLNTMYKAERAMEVAALCDPTVRRAVQEAGVELITFADV